MEERIVENWLFLIMGHSRPLFLYFRLFKTVDNVQYEFLLMTGFELRTSGLEATTLPTEPQPLPYRLFKMKKLSKTKCDRWRCGVKIPICFFNVKRMSFDFVCLRSKKCENLCHERLDLKRIRWHLTTSRTTTPPRTTPSMTTRPTTAKTTTSSNITFHVNVKKRPK